VGTGLWLSVLTGRAGAVQQPLVPLVALCFVTRVGLQGRAARRDLYYNAGWQGPFACALCSQLIPMCQRVERRAAGCLAARALALEVGMRDCLLIQLLLRGWSAH